MKRSLQSLIVGVVLRVVHAALVELSQLDTRVRRELERLPEGTAYSVYTGHEAPCLHVQWKGGRLCRLRASAPGACILRVKSMQLSFLLFTGQLGLAQAYAQHAFVLAGDVGDVMRLVRLVNLVEAYLFPRLITRNILTDIPSREKSPLRVYGRLCGGFLTRRYAL